MNPALNRLTKIVATIGPASRDHETLKKLLLAGVNVIRLNFSHADYDVLPTVISTIRELSQQLNRPVAILGDLQGPKFRTGQFPEGSITLTEGETIDLKACDDNGSTTCITTPNRELLEALSSGQKVLLADGAMMLVVKTVHSPQHVTCEVLRGGQLGGRKGINLPGVRLNVPALTEKDKVDARFILAQGLDFIALSFVQTHEDVLEVKTFLENHQAELPKGAVLPGIVSKIERPTSLDDIDAIIEQSDAIMVARGDLGVELSLEKVPITQKRLIQKANAAEKPVITATQMMESMIEEPVPTRAEVSDIVNAVLDGTDAVMLSAETASGKYPLECVRTMAVILEEAEKNLPADYGHHNNLKTPQQNGFSHTIRCSMAFHESVAKCAVMAAESSTVSAIVVYSQSGSMARRISKQKAPCPVITLTPEATVQRKLCLMWGIYPLTIPACDSTEAVFECVDNTIEAHQLLPKMAPIVFCAGETPLVGLSNTIKLFSYGETLSTEASSETPLARPSKVASA